MITLLIVLLALILLALVASFALGRSTYEVDSARDTEFVELEGTWVRYDVRGGGPPVVLVHGWLSSSRIWEDLVGRLAQRFTVYTLDLAGFGESDKPLSGYGVRHGSRLLYSFCAHFGLTGAAVIGHDIGGAMAAKLAADHQDVVGRLVMVATPANEEQIDLPTPLWLATLPVIGPLFFMLGRWARPVRRAWMRPFVLDPEDLTEDMVEDAAEATPASAGQTLSVTRREVARGRLARQSRVLKIPVLLVAGEEDQIVDPQAVGTWARGIEQAEVVLLDDCGHMPMIERTAEFDAQILAFLTGDPRYLDQLAQSRVAEADEEGAEEDSDEGLLEEPEPEARQASTYAPPYPPDEDTSEDATLDLSPRERAFREEGRAAPTPEEPPAGPLAEPPDRDAGTSTGTGAGTGAGSGDAPNVVRKQGGVYPPRNRDGSGIGSPSDAEPGGEEPRRVRRRRQRREPAEGDVIPDVPRDLFDWPKAWDEFRPGRGSGESPRRRPPADTADTTDARDNGVDEPGDAGPPEPPPRS